MAWFECTTSASSGNGVALIVTTDASFAGSNITASNGVDTFTQQCPSSAPYVVTFEDIPTGTYTISGVTGGQTVTKTYVVSDYNVEFHNTPTGSTATPVNVIQTWLHCADIWNKSYTTINQVLADTSTLLALISSNNAADYMARSTNWASSVCANQTAMVYIGNNDYCANKLLANSTWLNAICNSTYMESVLNVKVPTMTSNTTPYGVASASSENTPAYYAFTDASNTLWTTDTNGRNGSYIGYEFVNATNVYKAVVANRDDTATTQSIKQCKLQYFNNGWQDASEIVTLPQGGSGVVIANAAYSAKSWKLYGISNYGDARMALKRLQFYGRE